MTVSEQGLCPECGQRFTRGVGRGRPARYCGPVCRRAAEFALTRTHGLLRRAQQRWQDACLDVAMQGKYSGNSAVRHRDFWAGEVERLKGELRLLLTSNDVTDEAC